jgi:signal transduction histidine kinase
MKCSRCQHENRAGAKFCEECATPLQVRPDDPPALSYADVTSALTEALEQQTATSEILRVISQSPTDVQPVFDAIVHSAKRLLDGFSAIVTTLVGDELHLAAFTATGDSGDQALNVYFPRPLADAPLPAQAVRDRAPRFVSDVESDHLLDATVRDVARARGYRSSLAVPMLRDGRAMGVITVTRRRPGPFSTKEIALLQTFADQAVIAIENVRLFKELETKNRDLTEALEQQTATSEILRVISRSQTDVQPVFDVIASSALRLCDGVASLVFRHDGTLIHLAAIDSVAGVDLQPLRHVFPAPPERVTFAGRVVATARLLYIAEIEHDPDAPPGLVEFARVNGFRSIFAAPMLRDGQTIGVVAVTHRNVDGFTPNQGALLETFADQAVIAIENVRLFKELEARTQELSRSVDELTALGDVSQALSSTLDLETVLQTIVTRANQLAETAGCSIWEYDKGRQDFRLRVSHYADENDAALLQALGRVTAIPRGQGVTTQVFELRQPVQIHDITMPGVYESPIRQALIETGHRALLGVPLLSEDEVIGVLAVTRKTPGEFEPEIVRLLSTFATQSALAIQNARLFREIEEKSRELEAASRHKSEFLANMSHELRTPLNAIIGFSEVLAEGMFGEINEKQTEYLNDILESGRHLLSLINDILDLSKIEAGRMELEATDFDLPSAIESALILVRERAGRRGITLGREIDERLGEIHADERKVKQVLLNLLSNALKFTQEGGRIDVRAGVQDGMAEISVVDTGVGIAPEDQEAVFEEFRQVGTAAKRVEGTGLGLALSRKFIELHGGRIWLKSQVGVGSTFTFTLPLRHAQ